MDHTQESHRTPTLPRALPTSSCTHTHAARNTWTRYHLLTLRALFASVSVPLYCVVLSDSDVYTVTVTTVLPRSGQVVVQAAARLVVHRRRQQLDALCARPVRRGIGGGGDRMGAYWRPSIWHGA